MESWQSEEVEFEVESRWIGWSRLRGVVVEFLIFFESAKFGLSL